MSFFSDFTAAFKQGYAQGVAQSIVQQNTPVESSVEFPSWMRPVKSILPEGKVALKRVDPARFVAIVSSVEHTVSQNSEQGTAIYRRSDDNSLLACSKADKRGAFYWVEFTHTLAY